MRVGPRSRVLGVAAITLIAAGSIALALGAGRSGAPTHSDASASAPAPTKSGPGADPRPPRDTRDGRGARSAKGRPVASVTVSLPALGGGAGTTVTGQRAHEAAPAGSPPLAPLIPGRPPPPAHPIPAHWSLIAPGAPSDAQIALELAQERAVEHTLRSGFQTAVASEYTDYGYGLACGGVLGTNELGVANLTLPCGTPVTFRYGGRELTVPVIDRGPYIAGRLWDLTGATAAALNFPGLAEIQWKIG